MGRPSSQILLLVTLMLLGLFSSSAAVSVSDSLASVLRLVSRVARDETDGTIAGVGEAEQCGPKLTIETPSCKVVEERDGYELRLYPKGQIWVQATVENSTFYVASTVGFLTCFNFISGQNEKKQEIEMTGPVLIKPIPEKSGYSISFFAPSRFASADDLPRPNSSSVKFVETAKTLKAVIGPFGGFPTDSDYKKKWQQLKSELDKEGIGYDESSVVYAGYSSPFEIFNRKQEVHVTLT